MLIFRGVYTLRYSNKKHRPGGFHKIEPMSSQTSWQNIILDRWSHVQWNFASWIPWRDFRCYWCLGILKLITFHEASSSPRKKQSQKDPFFFKKWPKSSDSFFWFAKIMKPNLVLFNHWPAKIRLFHKTSLKLAVRTWKWMVGIPVPFRMVYFQVLCWFQGVYSIQIYPKYCFGKVDWLRILVKGLNIWPREPERGSARSMKH